MRMKNLGRITGLLLLSFPLWGEVKVGVDKEQITRGERVTFTLSISGDGELRVPALDTLCGYSIEAQAQSRKDIISNNKRLQEISLSYTFMPLESCTIAPFAVTLNGKEEMTKAVPITVSKISITKNEVFAVSIETHKKSFYVGEPFEMGVLFKERQNTDKVAESVSLAESKNIWIKSEKKGRTGVEEGYVTRKNFYTLAAQQSGKLSLGPLRWDAQVRSQAKGYWGTWIETAKTHSAFSNALELEVKPLPEGIRLVGELGIEVQVDKTQINANEALNVTIRVSGRANVEDIQPFELQVEGAQVFKEEPKVSHDFNEERYLGFFEQKLAIVAQRDFTLPAFELRYMDVKTDTLKTITSAPIAIKVLNAEPAVHEKLKISRPEESAADEFLSAEEKGTLSLVQGAFLLAGGFLLGLMASMLPWKRLFGKTKSQERISPKESKALLQLLMANMHQSKEIEELVRKLSENLYEGKKNEIDKKALSAMLKQLQK